MRNIMIAGGLVWKTGHDVVTGEHLGMIPEFLDASDPHPAAEQLHMRYSHGGGWMPLSRFLIVDDKLVYPASEDSPEESYLAIAETRLRNERVILFELAWVAVVQEDGSLEVSRMD